MNKENLLEIQKKTKDLLLDRLNKDGSFNIDGDKITKKGEFFEKQIVTILRSVHVNKDSREQFEQRTHKRLIDILEPNDKTVDALMKMNVPAGVDIEIKL